LAGPVRARHANSHRRFQRQGKGRTEEAHTVPEADVGAVLGFGFPGWTGGPISLIEHVGIARFVEQCDDLADRVGERFRPGQMLRTMAAENKKFY